MRRLVRSRAAFAVFVVLVVAGVVVGVRVLQRRVVAQAEASAIAGAVLVADLSVTSTVEAGVVRARPLTAAERADLDDHLSRLAADGSVAGLEIWSPTGALLYADPGRPATETQLPAAELSRSLRGRPWSQPSEEGAHGVDLHEILVPYDSRGDGTIEAIVEVLLPQDRIEGQVRRSSRLLVTLAGVVLVLLLLAFAGARRQLVDRERRSLSDPVTGLPNRAALLDRIDRVRRPRLPGSHPGGALLLFDLDEFKAVNDTLGHTAGDGLLVQVARTLRASVRPGDTVARLGGDEFGVLLADLTDGADAETAGRSLLERVRDASYVVAGVELSVDAGVGVAAVEDDVEADVVLQRADAALHRAKASSTGVAVYDPEADLRDVRQLALLVELRQAIENDELELHYQPKARLRTGEIVGVEALVRWRHPDLGLLAPDRFIPLAEGTRFIEPLTRWVLRHAIRQTGHWRDDGLMLPVAVNVSPRALLAGDFPATVLDCLSEATVPAELLELEITETAVLTDPEQAFGVCRRLTTIGARIAVDDFGAGYTSLSYLKRLTADTLKLDRAFVTHAVSDPKDRAVVEAVVGLAHRLGMTVVAEGIEDEATWRLLADLGYDEGQGYHLARPMPASDVLTWVRARPLAVDLQP